MADPNPTYVLGHSERELERLRAQGRLLEPVTKHFLREAGIVPGMRVLDVGCGTGAVAFLVAGLVGEAGAVIATDKAPAAIASAMEAAEHQGARNVRFLAGDPAEMEFDTPFDAVVGRYVLPYQADPAAMLRRLATHLRRGGVLVFHEPDFSVVRSIPVAPLYERACRWITDTSRLSGQSWSFLDKVQPAFHEAGLPSPILQMHTLVSTGANAREWLMAVGDMVESLLPAIERLRVATADEVDIRTLRDRLWEEVTSEDRVVVGRSEIGIWTRVG